MKGTDPVHRNNAFTEYYFTDDDTTGTKKEKTFIGRKHEDLGWDVSHKLNKEIKKEYGIEERP